MSFRYEKNFAAVCLDGGAERAVCGSSVRHGFFANQPSEQGSPGIPINPQQETPLQALPYTPGLDVDAMDRSVDPCVDFYTYSCGGWRRRIRFHLTNRRGASTAS